MVEIPRPVRYSGSPGVHPYYTCHISCPKHGVEVIGNLPEQVNVGTQSNWENPLPYHLAESLGSIGSSVSKVLGINPGLKAFSYQMWMGTEPIEIPLTIMFDAQTSALNDVFKPITELTKLVLPVDWGAGTLHPPGPIRGSGGYSVNIRLGRLMMFLECIIVSANETFDVRLAKDGYPIAGEVEMTFRTSKVFSVADWEYSNGFGSVRTDSIPPNVSE